MSLISEYTLDEILESDEVSISEIREDMPSYQEHVEDAPANVNGEKVAPQGVVFEWNRYETLMNRLEERKESLDDAQDMKDAAAAQLAARGPHSEDFYQSMDFNTLMGEMSSMIPDGDLNGSFDSDTERGGAALASIMTGSNPDSNASLAASGSNSNVLCNRQYTDQTQASLAQADSTVEDRAQAPLMTEDLIEIEDGENAAEYIYRQYEVDPREYHTDYDLRDEISEMDQKNRTREERRF